ncbi:MAG: hypothetical protein IT173_14380 [Acidobacteria bacterium]|nr:hypothetical protein [Acidobacteriota bacterium]
MSITITLSEKTEAKILRRAEEKGLRADKLVSDFVEEAWDEHFPESKNGSNEKDFKNPFESIIGMFSSGKTDTSERMSELLYGEDLDPAQGFGTDK